MLKSRNISSSMSPAAMVIAILALVLAGAGAGYSAATIGTSDIQNNAVTGKKVKNGSLKAVDLAKEKKYTSPTLGNGGDNDCLWSDVSVTALPGLRKVAYRTDRFGTTHLSGIAIQQDGPGGDAACGGMDAVVDYTIFTLPEGSRPAASLYMVTSTGNLMLVPGPGGLDLGGGTIIPSGAVLCSSLGDPCFLDGISFETARAKVTPRGTTTRPISAEGRELLRQLLER